MEGGQNGGNNRNIIHFLGKFFISPRKAREMFLWQQGGVHEGHDLSLHLSSAQEEQSGKSPLRRLTNQRGHLKWARRTQPFALCPSPSEKIPAKSNKKFFYEPKNLFTGLLSFISHVQIVNPSKFNT